MINVTIYYKNQLHTVTDHFHYILQYYLDASSYYCILKLSHDALVLTTSGSIKIKI